jgi:TolB-like protein
MSALIPGYEYDVFISYRQKDNKYDGWVTEFVSNLRKELDATFKDDISIYFDENPHDGLLETHHVDRSLENKIKCLVFIPILSSTYCDERSYAWNQEFLAFRNFSATDPLGTIITLNNGNAASRILPVRIHDLDDKDRLLFEKETGSPLRPVDFVFKAPGVNRPIRAQEEQPKANQNKTIYRDQVNKVANAIKELIDGMRRQPPSSGGNEKWSQERPVNINRSRIVRTSVFIALAALIALTIIFKSRTNPYEIAILPLQNKTGNPQWDAYSIGIASTARSLLTTSKEFTAVSSMAGVLQVMQDRNATLSTYGERLGVSFLLTGILQERNAMMRVELEFVKADNQQVKWVEQFDWDMKRLEDLDKKIQSALERRFSLSNLPARLSTTNPDAYSHYQRGQELLKNAYGDSVNGTDAYTPIIQQHAKAVGLDSLFIDAWTEMIAVECFLYQGRAHTNEFKNRVASHVQTFRRLFSEDSWQKDLVMGEYLYRIRNEYDSALMHLHRVVGINPNSEHAFYALSNIYSRKLMLREAIGYGVKLLHITRSHGGHWFNLGLLLSQANDNENALKAFLKGWELSQSENLARHTLYQAAGFGHRIQELPEALKLKVKKDFEIWDNVLARNWRAALKAALVIPDRVMVALIFRELDKMDSARHWIAEALQHNESDSTLFYELHGNRERALAFTRKSHEPPTPETELQIRSYELSLAIKFNDFPEATRLLESLMKDYPELDVWSYYNHYPFYDKIRLEYPPFAKLIKKPRPAPIVNIMESLSF